MIQLGDLKFPFTQIKIDFDQVERYQKLTPRRICFLTTHKTALKESDNPDYFGTFTIPFERNYQANFQRINKTRAISNKVL